MVKCLDHFPSSSFIPVFSGSFDTVFLYVVEHLSFYFGSVNTSVFLTLQLLSGSSFYLWHFCITFSISCPLFSRSCCFFISIFNYIFFYRLYFSYIPIDLYVLLIGFLFLTLPSSIFINVYIEFFGTVFFFFELRYL